MNYSVLFKKLTSQVASTVQYKRLTGPFKAFAVIATLPFWIIYGALICAVYTYIFAYQCVASSCDYLEGWIKETKEGVRHATEAVIYFSCIPFIFLLRIMLSCFSVAFYLLWFLTVCVAYIASLAGIKWTPFISNIDSKDNTTVVATTNKVAAQVIILIGFVTLCIYLLFFVFRIFSNDWQTTMALISIQNVFDWMYSLFMIISVPIAFKHKFGTQASVEVEASTPQAVAPAENTYEEEFPEF